MSHTHSEYTLQRQNDGMTLAAGDSPRTIAEALPVFLRHGSPFILLIAIVVAVAVRLLLGAWSWWDLVPAAAIVAAWPIQEWLIHVYILHFKPFALWGRTIDFRVPRKHREHHQQPWNYEILFIPMHSYIYSLPLLALLWTGLTPNAALAWTAIAVHLVLALHYEWIHFLIHTRVQPRLGYYQRLWRNHRLHHFKNEHYWFGVTRLEADRLLKTSPAAGEVPLSKTCRNLHAAGAAAA
jgi:hypothetical protein